VAIFISEQPFGKDDQQQLQPRLLIFKLIYTASWIKNWLEALKYQKTKKNRLKKESIR